MTQANNLALFLANEANEYQHMAKEDALATAKRNQLPLEIHSADDKVVQQIRQIYECLQRQPAQRPKAILVMAVRVNSLDRVAHDAAQAGIAWINLNRRMDNLSSLRQEFPEVPICFICPDQHEIGRIQGRQFRALLPTGGRILYVQGEATSSSARDRLEGMRESIANAKLEIASVLDGNWTTANAERVTGNWLRMVMSGTTRIDLIGCQSDAMAIGVCNALKTVSEYLKRPEIARIPVTGCDGVPNVGQKFVNQGQLAATVIIPSTGGPAVDLIARALNRGEQLAAEIKLPPASYPGEETLAQRSRKLS